MINQVVRDVFKGLLLQCEEAHVSAELYKLLLYEGAFFKPHKDSEKAPGMFGTLMVCLPSSHQGGDLVLHHNGEVFEFKTSQTSDFDVSYAAWYSDVLHEVKPVAQGYRLVLIYNLLKATSATISMPPTLTTHKEKVVALFKQWFVDDGIPSSPDYLVHKFEHQYTQASLPPELLKGSDLGQTQCLREAAAELGFSLYLASMERTITRDDEGDDFEIDRTTTLKHVVTMDGVRVDDPTSSYGVMIDRHSLLTGDDDEGDREADEEEHSGFTGNEGATGTYWYRNTVIVIVPPDRKVKFLHQCDDRPQKLLAWVQKLRRDAKFDAKADEELVELGDIIVAGDKPSRLDSMFYKEEDKVACRKLLQEIAETALELDWGYLFDQAVGAKFENMTLESFRLLGSAMTRKSLTLDPLGDRIKKVVKAAKSLKDKHDGLELIKEGFYHCPENRHCKEDEVAEISQFLEDLASTVVQEALTSRSLSKADGESLASFVRPWSEERIRTQVIPRMLQSTIACKIGFSNGLLAPIDTPSGPTGQNTEAGQHAAPLVPELPFDSRIELAKPLLSNIWSTFRLPTAPPKPATPVQRVAEPEDDVERHVLTGVDLRQLIEHTVSMDVLDKFDIRDRLFAAARNTTDKEVFSHTLLPFVEEVLRRNVPCYKPYGEPYQVDFTSTLFVTNVLLNYLKICVGKEPKGPVDWRLTPRGCGCGDCASVDAFLASRTETVGRFAVNKARRRHLHNCYNNKANMPYTLETLHQPERVADHKEESAAGTACQVAEKP